MTHYKNTATPPPTRQKIIRLRIELEITLF